MVNLPTHIPLVISPNDIGNYQSFLKNQGYKSTIFQIVRPRQIFGLVRKIKYNGMVVDHHVRAYTDGKITSEIELQRLSDMWQHLTRQSISAHEYIIDHLTKLSINFSVDETARSNYNQTHPGKFVKDYKEILKWLLVGVLFWTPLGYLWQVFNFISKFSFKSPPRHIEDAVFSD